MATFFDKQYGGRPFLLLLVWTLGILAFLFQLFGMMIDELTTGSLTVGGAADYKVICSSSTYDTIPGTLNRKYKDTGFAAALLQKQAGSAWLAFGILSCLFTPFLVYGIITDYFSGSFDHKKPIHYWKGCCMLQTWGFTRISAIFMIILQLLQIIVYAASNKCSKDEFYDDILGPHSDLKTIGGASYVMVVMSLLFLIAIFVFILYYQYVIAEELPSGEKKQSPARINNQSFTDPDHKPPKEPTPPPALPTGQAPESELFRPKRNVTKRANPSFMSEGDFSGAQREIGGTGAEHDRALSILAAGTSGMTIDGDDTNTQPQRFVPQPRPEGPPPMPPAPR